MVNGDDFFEKVENVLSKYKWLVAGILAIFVVIIFVLPLIESVQRRSRFTAGGMNETVPEFERFVPEQSWNDVIKKMSLDPQVSKSHENFVNSQNMLPTSARLTVREDVEETPFVGLRRPNYQVPISNSARTQPSVYQTSLPANNRRGLF